MVSITYTAGHDMEKVITRKSHGVITHVIVGWIAATIPFKYATKHAEMRGISLKSEEDGMTDTYYDIALDNRCILHILKTSRSSCAKPYFFEEYPF